jgi:peroxiredoxin
MSKKIILALALTVALLMTVQTVRGASLNTPAPNFSFKDTTGQTHTLSSYRGKVVLLEFFSQSCGVCLREMAQLKTVYNTFPTTSFVIISLGQDTDDTATAVKNYKSKNAIPWIMGPNPSAPSAHSPVYATYNKFSSTCGTCNIPRIYIIDKSGYIRYCHCGEIPSSTLISEIKTLMGSTITVTSPNGGEKWVRSTAHTITWSKSGSTGSYVKIELLKSGAVNRVIASSTANDGSYSWTIPSTQTPGTDYKIRITSTAYSSISDSSNSNFAITT